MAKQDPTVREVDIDHHHVVFKIHRCDDGKWIVEHPLGPTVVSASELVFVARMIQFGAYR